MSREKTPTKAWVWIIGIVVIVLGCCCVAVAVGGSVYLFTQEKAVSPSGLEEIPAAPSVSINTPSPQIETETPVAQSNLPTDYILAVTSSGIWVANEQTNDATQISHDPLDAPWDIKDGLSPDKKFFAYFTGFGGALVNPMLVVLDIEKQTSILQLELTGPIIQPGMDGTHGDPAFEAYGAMQFTDSFAWSPDGTRLAFVAARDGKSADIYLFNRSGNSVSRLTEEAGHATDLHWSPDGQLLQYLSVNTFGTGAGFNMEGLLVYSFQSKQTQLLETLESNGEDFLAWVDNSRFLINSTGLTCGGAYNLRLVDATNLDQHVIVGEGFTAAAYDPENKFGMFSVAYNYDNCGSDEPLDTGLMIFGQGIGIPIVDEIGHKKFEQVIAYGVGFVPQGNLFTVYGDEGLKYIYYKGQYGYNSLEILPEVKGFMPYPSPTGEYWAWASRGKAGLWVTKNNSNPVELSQLFTGVPLWSQDGQTLYYFENNRIFASSAPQFSRGVLVVEIPGAEILGIIK